MRRATQRGRWRGAGLAVDVPVGRGGGGRGGSVGLCRDGATGGRRKGLRKGDTTFSTMTLFRAGDPGEEGWLGATGD